MNYLKLIKDTNGALNLNIVDSGQLIKLKKLLKKSVKPKIIYRMTDLKVCCKRFDKQP